MLNTARHYRTLLIVGALGLPMSSAAAAWSCQPVSDRLDRALTFAGSSTTFADPARGAICAGKTQSLVASVVDVLGRGGVILLGEVHDNGHHHSARGLLIQHLSATAAGDRTAFVFEQIRRDQAAALDHLRAQAAVTSAHVFEALKWGEGGWPDQKLYQPLFEAVLPAFGRVFPGEPQRARVREVARSGLAALSRDEVQGFHLETPLAAAMQDALLTELEASHCGLMPKAAFSNMAIAQRYRDAHLASVALAARSAHGSAIVFAGNGHVRRDRGAPAALALMAPDVPVLVVQFQEIEQPPDVAIADVVVVTPAAQRGDPCVEMRARFGKKP